MSTNTTTTSAVIVKADAKIVSEIKTYVTAQSNVLRGYNGIVKAAVPVVARLGLTESEQVSELIRLSFYEQHGPFASEAEQAAYADQIKFDVSNMTTLILPRPIKEGKGKDVKVVKTTEELAAARDKALAYNDKLPKGCRPNLFIGQKSMLDIVRGKVDVDYVIGVKDGSIVPAKVETSQPAAAQPAAQAAATESSANAPEGQQAEVPQPQPQDGEKPLANSEDMLRSAMRTLWTAYHTNHGMALDRFKTIAADELSKLS